MKKFLTRLLSSNSIPYVLMEDSDGEFYVIYENSNLKLLSRLLKLLPKMLRGSRLRGLGICSEKYDHLLMLTLGKSRKNYANSLPNWQVWKPQGKHKYCQPLSQSVFLQQPFRQRNSTPSIEMPSLREPHQQNGGKDNQNN